MFSKNLGTCPLSNDAANDFFKNIVGVGEWHFKRDYTLLAVTRALLHKRMTQEDGYFGIKIKSINYPIQTIEANADNLNLLYDSMVDFSCLSQRILICNISGSNEANAKIFELLDNEKSSFPVIAERFISGFREAQDLRQFVGRHNINARFYVSDKNKATVIIVEKMELRSYHFLISLIPRYIRWYLVKQPLDAEEIQLCKALTEPYSLKFERMIAEFASRIDFRTYRIKNMMCDFEKRSRSRQLRDAERRVRDANERVRQNMESYQVLIRKLDEEKIRYSGLQQIVNEVSDNSELIQYMLRSKYINPTGIDDRTMGVIIHSYLDVFDPAMAARMLRKDTSVLISGYGISDSNGVFKNKENRRKFLEALFSAEPTFRIKTCAHMKIDLEGEVYPTREYRFPEEYADMIPNPHINRYTCLGQNHGVMRDRLLAGDVVGCLMQCVASTKCLNMSDTTVVSYFMDRLFRNTNKIIELPDKTSVTIVEAFEWLQNQEKAAQQAAAPDAAQANEREE